MRNIQHELHHNTPEVTVTDNRGLTVRTLRYHRHPDFPAETDERITRHHFNARGQLTCSIDHRLWALQQADATVAPNVAYVSSLTGDVLRTDGVDNGTTVTLNDIAGRPVVGVTATGVTRTFQYEDDTLPGRLLGVTEQIPGEAPRITDRFVWAGNSPEEKDLNLAGQAVRHYDTAGLSRTDSLSLTGAPQSVSRQLLQDAVDADWQATDTSAWQDLLAPEVFTTRSTADATGAVLTTTDAKGNVQRLAYDIAGQLRGSWLTLSGGAEQVIVASLTWSAAGQKLQEVHGNGLVTSYSYEPETQRLVGIKTARTAGHASGARVLQDLRYTWDPVGNVVKVSNDAEATRFWRNQKVVPENTYVYDSLYQLVEATGREMAGIGQQGSQLPAPLVPHPADDGVYTNYTRTYRYDRGNNLEQIRHSALATGNNYTTDITVSSRSNRAVLSSLTEAPHKVDDLFDSGGHQLQLLPGQNLDWTARGELGRVTPVVREGNPSDHERYRYGRDGMRVSKVSAQQSGNNAQTQRTLYLPGLELRTAHQGETLKEDLHTVTMGEAGRAQVRVLHWASGAPEGLENDRVRYSYDNLIGSSGLEVDGEGKLISQEEYYPFGGTAVWAARNEVEAGYKTQRYSGKERDATGLYYYGYRYYQPWAGRWLSADPAGTIDGLNLYRMVKNNPVTHTDKNGLVAEKPDDFRWVKRSGGGSHDFAGMSLFSENNNLARKAEYLTKNGVGTVIALESENYEASKEALNEQGINFVLFPINDWHAPSVNQLEAYNALVDEYSKFGKVATHCWGGTGRTGVFLASRLLHIGEEDSAQGALMATRERYHKKSIEMKAQYNALARFSDNMGFEPSVKVSALQVHWDESHGDDGMSADPGHNKAKNHAGVDSNWMNSVSISDDGISVGAPSYEIFPAKPLLTPTTALPQKPVVNHQNGPLGGIPLSIPLTPDAASNKVSLWKSFKSLAMNMFRHLFCCFGRQRAS